MVFFWDAAIFFLFWVDACSCCACSFCAAGILGFGDTVVLAAVVFGSFEVVSDVFGDVLLKKERHANE